MLKWIVIAGALTALVAGALYFGEDRSAGSSSAASSSSPSTEMLSSSFVDEANELCGHVERAFIRLAESERDSEQFLSRLIPLNERWNDRISAMAPPPEKSREFAELTALLDEDEKLWERLLAIVRRRDQLALDGALTEMAVLTRKQDAAWRALGAHRCATHTSIHVGDGPSSSTSA
jgi:hypothetical protein